MTTAGSGKNLEKVCLKNSRHGRANGANVPSSSFRLRTRIHVVLMDVPRQPVDSHSHRYRPCIWGHHCETECETIFFFFNIIRVASCFGRASFRDAPLFFLGANCGKPVHSGKLCTGYNGRAVAGQLTCRMLRLVKGETGPTRTQTHQ